MEKKLYVQLTDNIDGDTWVLGEARNGGLSSAMEWIKADLENNNNDDDDMIDIQYTISFVMMTEQEVNALPEP